MSSSELGTVGLLVAVGVDLLVDGILVGLSVATLGPAAGIALTIALTLVVLPLALSVTVEVSRRGVGRVRPRWRSPARRSPTTARCRRTSRSGARVLWR